MKKVRDCTVIKWVSTTHLFIKGWSKSEEGGVWSEDESWHLPENNNTQYMSILDIYENSVNRQ